MRDQGGTGGARMGCPGLWRETVKGWQGGDRGRRGSWSVAADERGGEGTAVGERGSGTVVRAGGGRLRGGSGRSRVSKRILF